MAYCAVNLKTESGDSYTVLVEYRTLRGISEYLHEILEDELAYVYEVKVDSGIDSEEDDKIEGEIWRQIEVLKESL